MVERLAHYAHTGGATPVGPAALSTARSAPQILLK
jgi:hypothetical protein